MQAFPFYLSIILLATSCSWLNGGEGDDPLCESVAPIDDRIRSAIPYRAEQTLDFDVSDKTSLTATVREMVFEPTRGFDCAEETFIDFEAINVNSSLQVEIALSGDLPELRFPVEFTVNGLRENDFLVSLDEDGAIIASSTGRIIPDTVLNGQPYTNVLAEDYSYLSNSPVSSSYYSSSAGFIGVELTDSTSIFLR